MARTSLQDLRSLSDVLMGYNFDFIIPNIPGGGDTRALTIKCKTATIPGIQFDDVLIGLHGAETIFPGREVFTHNVTITYIETRDMTTRSALRTWLEMARNVTNNSGNFKSTYATTAQLIMYDDTGATVRTFTLYDVYPKTLDDISLDGSASAAVEQNCTLAYSFHTEN